MIQPTDYTVPIELLYEAMVKSPSIDSRIALNEPTGRFFYDAWRIKPEYRGTAWEQILDSLPVEKGEARLIRLAPGECYPQHADIDDRYHLNITGNNSYLIDLIDQQMYDLKNGVWYAMDAGRVHTAANFGSQDRIQLVVRHLLPEPVLKTPVKISITLQAEFVERRFLFDNLLSPWINRAYKRGIIQDFHGEDLIATMTVEESAVEELKNLIWPDFFIITRL